MKFYVDTSLLIGIVKGHKDALRLISTLDGILKVPAFAYYEFYSGIEFSKLKGKPTVKEQEFIDALEVEFPSGDVFRKAAEIRATCMHKGVVLGDADYIIAAQAICSSGKLLTLDKDFSKIKRIFPELSVS